MYEWVCLAQVALLFLTRLWLPYEPVWRAFLDSVPAMGKGRNQGWQLLFSLHVHLPPNHFFNNENLFSSREVEERVTVEWGQWSVVSLSHPSDLLNHTYSLTMSHHLLTGKGSCEHPFWLVLTWSF